MQAQFTFGSFRFEPATARLWDNSAEVKLTRKAALLLGALLESSRHTRVQAGVVRERLARHGGQ
jgi:DNA-binding winged helix-turn-helix (wHTH) protein